MVNPKTITARELMNDDILSLREDTTISEAISTLEEYHITGAPVVNEQEECVGIFSSTDVLKRNVERDDGTAPIARSKFDLGEAPEESGAYFSKDDYDEEILGRDTVGNWMTTEVKFVSPEATAEEVCRRMLDESVHRILVMKDRKLLGIITTFDIVRLVAGLAPDRKAKGTVKAKPNVKAKAKSAAKSR